MDMQLPLFPTLSSSVNSAGTIFSTVPYNSSSGGGGGTGNTNPNTNTNNTSVTNVTTSSATSTPTTSSTIPITSLFNPTTGSSTIIQKEGGTSSSNNDITITITPIGIQIFGLPPFLMRKHTLFKRLFAHVAQRFSIDENELIFTFNDRISPNQCPNDIGLENGDTIVVRKVSLKKKISFDSKQINFSGFVDNISSLYDTQNFSDITFKLSDGTVLYGHKNILSSRCAKFKAMFTCEMIESTKKEIEILDHKPAVFRKMIEYLYTDSLNEDSFEMILQLIVIADEYILESLKNICESKLILEIDHTNVSNIFIKSDLYNCKNLKKASLDHILSNIKKLVGSKDFECSLTESPGLLYEILKEMAPHFDTTGSMTGKKRKDFFGNEFNRSGE